jgi:radical SAM protein with 4Fe4S-binding SPASM domain
MCPAHLRPAGPPYGPPAFMAWELFTRILDELEDVQHLHLQGMGEPTIHPRFLDMVRYAARRGIRVTTSTNLTLIHPRRAGEFVTSGLDTIHVSIDAATPEAYERIRANASFEHVVRNLEGVLRARDRLNGNGIPRVHLVAVAMRQNLQELPALVGLAHEWGVDEMFVQHLCHTFREPSLPEIYRPMRTFVTDQTLLYEDITHVEAVFDEATRLAETLEFPLRLPRARPKPYAEGTPGHDRCDWPWHGAYVTYDGYVMPCCMVSTPDRVHMGRLTEQSFEALWNGEGFRSFRRRLDGGPPPEVCDACSLYRGTF